MSVGGSINHTDVDSREPSQDVNINFVFEPNVGDNRPHLKVRIFGKMINALLDSGASQSVLGGPGLWVLDKFPTLLKPIPNRWVETADAKRHTIKGCMKIPITLEGRTKNIDVYVVPALKQTLILGIDFWTEMQLVTDLSNRTWEFSPSRLTIYSLQTQSGLLSEEHLNEQEKEQLDNFVTNYLGTEETRLGRTDKVQHIIDTGDAVPVKQRYYPMSPARLQVVNQELDRMLEMGVVEKSQSAWSSPIVLLDKPDGSKRFCVNYQQLNARTKRDAYPLPLVTNILDRLRDARYLSSLDIKSAYWQIPLHPDSREKTAFTVQGRGLFHFITMPFGLHNAPATWQRFIDHVVGADLEPHVFVYLDDVVIVTPTFEQHLEVLKEVLRRLRDAGLTLNKDKCKLCRPELRYLGYMVDFRGLRVDPEKVEAILQIPVPRSQKSVRQFCGTASWYRRFIPNFASRIYPLTTLLKRNNKFQWTSEAQEAFEDIKSCLITAPILTCPDFSREFTISCDASGIGLGAVLSQETEQGEAVVAYGSRTLTKAEQKLSATERECLAVIWSVEKFRPYIEGTHFKVITDHYSLLWLKRMKDPQGRLARWALRLQPYDFELIHRKGEAHVVPDLLSRTNITEDINIGTIVGRDQPEDKWYVRMKRNVIEQGDRYPLWKVEDDSLWKLLSDKKNMSKDEESWKRVLPKNQRVEVLHQLHDAPTAGHLGIYKTFSRVKEQYYWPKMHQDIARYVNRCRVCQATKSSQNKPSGLCGQRRGVNVPWAMISADLLGPFPRTTSGFKYVLVVMDTFTKFSLLFPLRSATSKVVSKHLEEDVFLMFGIPKYLICDNGAEFTGQGLKWLASEYKVRILYNPSRHPQANPTERVNKTIGNMLRAYVGDNHRSWDKNLSKIAFALRTAKHEVTEHTPAYLNFGRELHVPAEGDTDVSNAREEIPPVEESNAYGRGLEELKILREKIKESLNKAYEKNVHRYNLRRRPGPDFKEGSLVWRKNFPQSDATKFFAAKLAPKYTGPYRVKKRISPLVFTLEDEHGRQMGNWHISHLKKYN